ncbi:MAG: SURF1 family protein [Rhodobacteraceae bacterium]|nr:SURF1 family protein [Paracoccaceae bacterium]
MRRTWFFLIFGLAGLALLLSLGVWQVQRLGWKQDVLARIEAQIAGDPIALPTDPDPEADRYQPVSLSGRVAEGELHVLVSVKRTGPGYRVIVPFETDNGRRILLDTGFIPTEAKGTARPTGPAALTGNLHWPDEIDGFTPEPDVEGNIWFARDVPTMAEVLGTESVMVVAREPVIRGSGVGPLPVDTASIPNDHLNYAITWFSLAAIWSVIIVVFLRRSRQTRES